MQQSGSLPRPWAIEVQGLTKWFGNHLALAGIDLKVKYGESVVIFGPNGAGKTTLIKVVATIMSLSSGEISVDGVDIKRNAEEARRKIGVVTHQTFLYSNLTAYENLKFYSRMYGVAGGDARIHEVVSRVGMISRLHSRVGTLSRGMQQRLSIARALLHEPTVMLLDEPETGLDQHAISVVWDMLRVRTERKQSIILTTHNLEKGLDMCDRVLILDKGRIAYEGARRDLDMAGLKQAYRMGTGGLA